MAEALANSNSTPLSSLSKLVRLAGLSEDVMKNVTISGSDPVWPTRYKVVNPGAAVMAATGVAAADLWALKTGRRQDVRLDGHAVAAALRSPRYLRIDGKKPEPDPDNITGFYRLRDGRWMYLHCNFWNLRDANVAVLGVRAKRDEVEPAVAKWDGIELENTLFERGGCGSFVRSEEEWRALPQMHTVANLPLFEIIKIGEAPPEPLPAGDRPLSGIRVLDLTRVLDPRAPGRSRSTVPMCFASHVKISPISATPTSIPASASFRRTSTCAIQGRRNSCASSCERATCFRNRTGRARWRVMGSPRRRSRRCAPASST